MNKTFSSIKRDKNYNSTFSTTSHKIPRYTSLDSVGGIDGEPGYEGNIFLNRDDKFFYGHNGEIWVQLSGDTATTFTTVLRTDSTTITKVNEINTISAPEKETIMTLNTTSSSAGNTLWFNNLGPLTSTIFDTETGYNYNLETTNSNMQLVFDGDIWRVVDQNGVKYGYDLLQEFDTTLTPTDYIYFGRSVAMTSDGSRIIIGGGSEGIPGKTVHIYRRENGQWVLEQVISGEVNSNFGFSVDISANGTKVVIGSPLKPDTQEGSVYIYKRTGTIWSQEEQILSPTPTFLGNFGNSVSMTSDGTRISIGAKGESGGAGKVYIYHYNGIIWDQEDSIISTTPRSSGLFGYSTSISSDGTRVVIGAPRENSTPFTLSGNVYIFLRTGTTWEFEERLVSPNAENSGFFGHSVDISAPGTRIVIGANNENSNGVSDSGQAYVFRRSGIIWVYEDILESQQLDVGGQFGEAVSMSADGLYVIVGAAQEKSQTSPVMNNVGSAYIFAYINNNWIMDKKLVLSEQYESDCFGCATSMSADGSLVLIGAYTKNIQSPFIDGVGRAYMY